ncbi:hypothetical protein M378DRAFT_160176 [Amanita muscaria Koide BX008]|uniref:Uncharacterized protein n=1 Tax=Amanita muscaria (strain Koide BX008) TaxID=946122 RepID=A0A0C2SUR7_AMAMK|nr:hypothetical protein M378DRAFT_160176 [Amanita muscaria Koide BX008]
MYNYVVARCYSTFPWFPPLLSFPNTPHDSLLALDSSDTQNFQIIRISVPSITLSA